MLILKIRGDPSGLDLIDFHDPKILIGEAYEPKNTRTK